MAIVDYSGIPLSVCLESATPHESQLVEGTLRKRHFKNLPQRIVGDKAYDSDSLDAQLARRYRIELIAPNKSNRKKRTQDGRALRRYKRRWKIERFFSWMQSYKRVATRYDHSDIVFEGMVQMATALILLKFLRL